MTTEERKAYNKEYYQANKAEIQKRRDYKKSLAEFIQPYQQMQNIKLVSGSLNLDDKFKYFYLQAQNNCKVCARILDNYQTFKDMEDTYPDLRGDKGLDLVMTVIENEYGRKMKDYLKRVETDGKEVK